MWVRRPAAILRAHYRRQYCPCLGRRAGVQL